MNIILNGQSIALAKASSLADLLEQTGQSQRRVAVEVNSEIVPRSRYAQQQLQEGDRIEIVQAIGGG